MKIALVNSYYYPTILGGAEYSVKKLAEGLARNGHQVIVICSSNYDSIDFINGVKIYRMKVHNCISANNYGTHHTIVVKLHRILEFCNIFNYRMFKKVISEEHPDIIHTNGLYEITPIIWINAKKKNIPIIHTLRDYYLICRHVNMRHIKDNSECKEPSIGCKLYRKINRRLCKYVDVVTAPSLVTLNCFMDNKFFDKAQHFMIENATEFSNDELRKLKKIKLSKISMDTVTFVFLGTLSENKGINWLLKAFEGIKNPNIRLKIAGKGELEDKVMSICKVHNSIDFLGFLDSKQVNKLLIDSDVLICPSMWQEPFGRVVLDGYSALMPAIVSNMGALPHLVDNEKTGNIVKNGDINQLRSMIEQYAEDRSMITNKFDAIISKLQDYSLEKQVNTFEKLYKSLLENN